MPDSLAEALVEQMNGLRRVLRRRLRAGLGGLSPSQVDLPPSQVELLRTVEATPGIGVAATARAMSLANNTVSSLVYQLVDAGYLRRETDPTDRRAARLFLSPAAAERLRYWRDQRTRLLNDALGELSATDRQAIEQALPVLRRLGDLLTAAESARPAPVGGPVGQP